MENHNEYEKACDEKLLCSKGEYDEMIRLQAEAQLRYDLARDPREYYRNFLLQAAHVGCDVHKYIEEEVTRMRAELNR